MEKPESKPEQLELCGYCKKEVAKVNLSMHEVHCQRFLCLCPDCGESVPKEKVEDHRAEQHAMVRCQKCGMKMEQCKLSDHETDECSERPQSCEFCDLELPLSALMEHTVTCGSRTERCPDCKRYVTLKNRSEHARICSSALSEDNSYSDEDSADDYMKLASAENLQDDEKSELYGDLSRDSKEPEEPKELEDFSFLTNQKKGSGAAGFGDLDQINTCPHCHLALPLQTLKWHEDKCKLFESLKLIK
ncbi:XIAP-associated factor 1 [Hoplias malabaricus]|uniref:XIAP-associated factor 1 n=1 Tax=Hoplias malabaricus TaxID=27720 RepID=UPI0034626D07